MEIELRFKVFLPHQSPSLYSFLIFHQLPFSNSNGRPQPIRLYSIYVPLIHLSSLTIASLSSPHGFPPPPPSVPEQGPYASGFPDTGCTTGVPTLAMTAGKITASAWSGFHCQPLHFPQLSSSHVVQFSHQVLFSFSLPVFARNYMYRYVCCPTGL